MRLNPGAPEQTSEQFWLDKLHNLREVSFQLDQAIAGLSSGAIVEYTIDTGQDRQTVKKSDVSNLFSQQQALLSQIAALEARLGIGGARAHRVVPLW